jgi:hypothetical protein
MIYPRHFFGMTALLAALVFLVPAPTFGQGHGTAAESATEEHEPAEHEYHVNHFGGFIGASTHLDSDQTGATLGLEYARQFHPRWSVAGYLELVSGSSERDMIIFAGIGFYPVPRLALVMAPGLERVEKDVEHHGELVKENENELVVRFGAAYGFPVSAASLGPAVFADYGGNRWTIVYGVSMVVGF